jgi:acyl-CoA synthetase (AMP-forming)/AMP-acid ligase II
VTGLELSAGNVGELFLRSVRLFPGLEAVVDGDERFTYADLADRAGAIARRLVGRGIRPGDRLALMLPNGWRYGAVYFGAQLAGAVVVLVNSRLSEPEIAHVLEDSGATALVVESGAAASAPAVCPPWDVEQLAAAGPTADEFPGTALDAARPANLLYTSGTTGRPKGAVQTHGNLVFNAGTVGSVFGVAPGDRTLVVAPMFHATGINSQWIGFLAHGATAVMLPQFSAAMLLRALVAERITFFAGVTAMIQLMTADPAFPGADLHTLRTICFGGGPVAPALVPVLAQVFPQARMANVWGQTEATSITTCALGEEFLQRPWSVGRAVPGLQVAVHDGSQRVPPGDDAVGELWVRGPSVTAGYWGRPEASAETFRRDGWLRTGDIGRIDADGYVQVLDRLKDMIIRGGENIYSLEVESVLAQHPAVAEVAVVGIPDTIFGERVRAVVALRADEQLTLADLRSWAADRLADYKLPEELSVMAHLPRNPAGKILKRNLVDTDGATVSP